MGLRGTSGGNPSLPGLACSDEDQGSGIEGPIASACGGWTGGLEQRILSPYNVLTIARDLTRYMLDPPSRASMPILTNVRSKFFVPIADEIPIIAASPTATLHADLVISATAGPPVGVIEVFAFWFYRRAGTNVWIQIDLATSSHPDCQVVFDPDIGYYTVNGHIVLESRKSDLTIGGSYGFQMEARTVPASHSVTLAGLAEIST